MKRLFAYTRVSTAKQGEKGVSLQEQHDAISRYADRNGLPIAEWFEERQTAAKRGRPVFTAMLKALRAGKAAGVVIHKIDRSARNLRDWADLGELIDSGIEVHFANEPLDLRSRGGRLSADILAVVAADFIRNNREETRKGFYGRLKQGIYPLNAPLGYLDQGGGKVKTIDPAKGSLVRFAFERYATGEVSLFMLLDELTARGLRNRRDKPLSLTGLTTILQNPFYAGVIRLRRTGESFVGAHEPLITASAFRAVQDVFAGKRPRRLQIHSYLFRRLFACASCGRSLIASRHKGHIYYRCQTLSCPTTCVREEALISAVRDTLARTAVPGAVVDQCQSEIRKALSDDAAARQSMHEHFEGVVGAATTRLQRLTDLFADGAIDRQEYEKRRAAALLDQKQAREKLGTEGVDLARLQRSIEKCLELARSPQYLYENASEEEKRQILTVMTSNRRVSGKDVEISVAEPFLFLAKARDSLCCAPTVPKPRIARRLAKKILAWARTNEARCLELGDLLPPKEPTDDPALLLLAA